MDDEADRGLTDEDHSLHLSVQEWRALDVWPKWREQAADLMGVDTTLPVRWVPGAERIIRRGERQMWVAKQGEGKTQVALHLTAQVCEAGGYVAYVDVENDPQEMAERLQPIVADLSTAERVRESLLYLPGLDLPGVLSTTESAERFVELAKVLDLLVIDSLTRVLASFDLDEDSNKDFAAFMRAFPDALAQAGIAVLMLDNAGHEGVRPRGAISKAALVEAVYDVSGGTKVAPDKHGALTLKKLRSRSGKIAEFVSCESGGGRHTPLAPQDGAENVTDAKQRQRRDGLAALLRDDADRAWTLTEVAGQSNVTRNTAKADVDALVAEGIAEQIKDGRSTAWKFRRGSTVNQAAP
jgi:AAA domain